MSRPTLLATLLLLGGCPTALPDGLAYFCGDGGPCPAGLVCGGTGYCESMPVESACNGWTDGGCTPFGTNCQNDAQCCAGHCRQNTCCLDISSQGGTPRACGCNADCCADLTCGPNGRCCIPPTSTQGCQANSDCCGGQCYPGGSCIPPAAAGSVALGATCNYPSECAGGGCDNHVCCVPQPSQGAKGGCRTTADCCGQLTCLQGGCCLSPGQDNCNANADCCSGICGGDGHCN